MPLPELPPVPAAADKSVAFIDITAKLSLLMAVLGIVWCVLQLLVVTAIGRMDLVAWLRADGLLPPAGLQQFETWALPLTLLMLAGALAFLAVSWGFLRHREWGRQGMIVFLVLVALLNFAAVPLISAGFDALQAMLPHDLFLSPEAHELRMQLRAGRWLALLSTAATAVGLAAAHAWLVVKLRRPQVRAVFR